MFCFEIKKGTRNALSFLFLGGGKELSNTGRGLVTAAPKLPQLLQLNLQIPCRMYACAVGYAEASQARRTVTAQLFLIIGYLLRSACLHLLLFLARVSAWAWDRSLIVASPAQLADDDIWQLNC